MSATDNAANAKPELGLLEEDDEFEEFPAEEWGEDKEDKSDLHQWEDNWDDDNIEDDFSLQLRYIVCLTVRLKYIVCLESVHVRVCEDVGS